MNNTPNANRKNIVIVGNRNAGKSTIFNTLIGHERSIVSNVAGTTTDPVWKAWELIGFGPVRIVDTAGIDDIGELGAQRIRKSEEEINESDLILYVINVEDILEEKLILKEKIKEIKEKYKNRQFIFIINKCDTINSVDSLKSSVDEDDVMFISSNKSQEWYDNMISMIIKKLESTEEEKSPIDGMLKKGDTALLVVPIDTEAPKGRLILPQVQVIRACLDEGVKVVVCRDVELEETIYEQQKIDLVITDSNVFEKVGELVPNEIPITSFSILFAREKGDIAEFLKGAETIKKLKDGDRVLIAESCTHTVSHEDIGQVVIPRLVGKKSGKNLEFDFSYGKSLPEELDGYSLIIQCGGCMMTRGNMMNRVYRAKEKGIPITNYGVILAYLKGVFNRAKY